MTLPYLRKSEAGRYVIDRDQITAGNGIHAVASVLHFPSSSVSLTMATTSCFFFFFLPTFRFINRFTLFLDDDTSLGITLSDTQHLHLLLLVPLAFTLAVVSSF